MSTGNPSLRGGFLARLKSLHSPSFKTSLGFTDTCKRAEHMRPSTMDGFWFVGWGLGKANASLSPCLCYMAMGVCLRK